MPIKFQPHFIITPEITKNIIQIEASKEKAAFLPLTPTVLASLRKTAKLLTTHYSTMIEGNRLQPDEIKKVIEHKKHFPGRKRDELEIRGYYAAFNQLEKYVAQSRPITQTTIKTLHALVMSDGCSKVKPSTYREGQNIIKDGQTGTIVYMPPQANDVAKLMGNLVSWINDNNDLHCPLVASIAHYQFATIHPYYDGNGRTARLLTSLILHLGGYGLKGLYSLEEYYAKNLRDYYQALTVGPSHNYYLGRAQADITPWIDYFCRGMAYSCEKVIAQMQKEKSAGKKDFSVLLKKLDKKQRKVLDLFREYDVITNKQVGDFFGFKPRTSSKLCASWVQANFLEIVDPSRKGRTYRLANQYQELLKD